MTLSERVSKGIERLRRGEFVLIYDSDDREGEVDLFIRAESVEPHHVSTLRREAGGLIFLAVDSSIALKLGLPFLEEVLRSAESHFPVLAALRTSRLPYDSRSSFSLTLNERRTFTGITDMDRALTARSFADLARELPQRSTEEARVELGRRFRTPGHLPLCVAAQGLLKERKGHTELACALAHLAGVTPVLLGAEMLGEGGPLPLPQARLYARRAGTVLLTGEEIEREWAKVEGVLPPLGAR